MSTATKPLSAHNATTRRKNSLLARTLMILMCIATISACTPRPAANPTPASIATNATANDILFRAIGLVGTPYRYGGNTPLGGFDCSGLVGYVYNDVAGIVLPRSADQMSRIAATDVHRNRLQPGDLVFFGTGRHVDHVGIYAGAGRFIHAPNRGGTVRLDLLDSDYWRDHFSRAKRLLH